MCMLYCYYATVMAMPDACLAIGQLCALYSGLFELVKSYMTLSASAVQYKRHVQSEVAMVADFQSCFALLAACS